MRTPILPLALLASVSLACDPASDAGQPTDDAAGGKADGAAAVDVQPADEPLFATSLRQQLCSAIGQAHPWSTVAERNTFVDDCLDHQFTLTETSKSTLYAHLDDGDAMTMQMKVRVEDADHTWETSLTRDFSDFRFHWTARVDSLPAGDDRDAFIKDLADDVGEFFGPDDFPEHFRSLGSFDELPQDIRDVALTRLAEIDEELQQNAHDPSGAELSDEFPYEIVRDGEVVGYVVEIWFFIDHPLFDGGGTTLYINVLGDILEEVDWFG